VTGRAHKLRSARGAAICAASRVEVGQGGIGRETQEVV
jgi:hypothetical protein